MNVGEVRAGAGDLIENIDLIAKVCRKLLWLVEELNYLLLATFDVKKQQKSNELFTMHSYAFKNS